MTRIAALVINFNTAALTQRCVESLLDDPGIALVHVLDNGSDAADCAALGEALAERERVRFRHSSSNLGFAVGSNLALTELLEGQHWDGFLLLNSDARLLPGGLAALLAEFSPATGVALVGGRVLRPNGEVDSLGIAFYASCLASNRKTLDDAYFGPTGGCALYGRGLIEKLRDANGHIFDPDFFCYAEDTDLAARALLLGYRPGYTNLPVAEHEGQASSGGGFNDFVLYHGIRNSIWMVVKCVPGWTLLALLPLIVALHAAIVLRHALRGRAGVIWRLYRDAIQGLPTMLRKRRAVQRLRRIDNRGWRVGMTFRFYDADFLTQAWRDLWRATASRRRKP